MSAPATVTQHERLLAERVVRIQKRGQCGRCERAHHSGVCVKGDVAAAMADAYDELYETAEKHVKEREIELDRLGEAMGVGSGHGAESLRTSVRLVQDELSAAGFTHDTNGHETPVMRLRVQALLAGFAAGVATIRNLRAARPDDGHPPQLLASGAVAVDLGTGRRVRLSDCKPGDRVEFRLESAVRDAEEKLREDEALAESGFADAVRGLDANPGRRKVAIEAARKLVELLDRAPY